MAVKRNVVAVSLVGAAVAGGLVGCGGDTSNGTVFGTKPKPSVSASGSTAGATGLDAFTAKEISDRAKDALKSVSSVKVDFAAVDRGKAVQLKAAMSRSGECAGAMSQGKETMQFIGADHVSYMKANDAFWKDAGGKNADGLLELVHGKWMKVPGDAAKDKDLASFCDLDTFLKELSSDDDAATFSKGRPTTVDGQPVVTIIQKKSATTTTIYVASVGTPYPLKITNEGGSGPGHATFADFDKPVKAVAPPASETVDVSKFMGDGSKSV
ncbi:hypothetical protein QMK19_13480 [Streptomyces sp. H10-C2]|uniref:hypothetical protein n=1 Tax=unclassified Streptomyces TaxID=2593676 RepID=UPI0024B95FBE|nr:MULTISPECIES: hypothetical protein [unclassified Streptomyces]MDJ0343200.1 hypothetical protein [Streptomyces sp. PH10-H1]MDJ0370667.1 hypothetical protein [Streptomyces sp. H10-C2]